MIQIMSSGGKVTYGVNEYVIDKDNEVTKIPNTAAAGSTAYSIESETTFIKDNGGNWVVKNAAGSNSGGNSIELPDNILYSYEMEYNEFWDKKNNNVLEDGLYKVTLNNAVTPVAETTVVELPQPYLLKGTCDEKLCWILDYNNNALLQINEFGEIEKISSIQDMVDYQTFTVTDSTNLQQHSYMNIDNQKYLYISGQGQNVIGINTNDISDGSNWKFNQGMFDSEESIYWVFQSAIIQGGGYQKAPILDKNKLLNFNVKDGGCFAVKAYESPWDYQGEMTPDVAYFKNGELKFIEEKRDNTILFDHTLATVDYNLNKLYFIGIEFNQLDFSLSKLKLCTVNTLGEQEEFDLCYYNTTLWWNLRNELQASQIFVKNDILYFQFFSNNDNSLHYFLFDTVTNQLIQQETIVYNNLGGSQIYDFKNDIHHWQNCSIVPFTMEGDRYVYNEETGESWGEHFKDQRLIKIYYSDDASYAYPEEFSYNLIHSNKLFIDHCYEDKFFYKEVWNSSLSIYNLLENDIQYDIVSMRQDIMSHDFKINFPSSEEIFMSYISPYAGQSECIKINFETGNVEQVSLETDENCISNTALNDYFKEDEIAFIDNCAIDTNDLKTKYIINYSVFTEKFQNVLAILNGKNVYYSNFNIGYTGTGGSLNTSQLLHDNNILLSKNL